MVYNCYMILQLKVFCKEEEHPINKWRSLWTPLDLRYPIRIYPQETMVTVAVGNKFIVFLLETTLLCKLNAQVTISPEQFDIRVPPGPFRGAFSDLGSFSFNLKSSPCEGKLYL